MKITIPKGLTAKKIIKDCDNKTSTGTPVLYSISWYEKEDFYTTEKTRGGVFKIDPIAHKGKSWDECKALETKELQMLTFAELLYVMVEHEKQTKEHFLGDWEYSWTSSRASDGSLVYLGDFGSRGAAVSSGGPEDSCGSLGVCLSHVNDELMSNEILNPSERTANELPNKLIINGISYTRN